MKRGVLLVALALVFVPSAEGAVRPGATTIVVEDGSPDWPYQRWVNKAFAPTPNVTVTVIEECGQALGRSSLQAPWRIWVCPSITPLNSLGFVFGHELGHIYDATVLQKVGNRAVLLQTAREYLPLGLDYPDSEFIPDLYAQCLFGGYARKKEPNWTPYPIGAARVGYFSFGYKVHRRLCGIMFG